MDEEGCVQTRTSESPVGPESSPRSVGLEQHLEGPGRAKSLSEGGPTGKAPGPSVPCSRVQKDSESRGAMRDALTKIKSRVQCFI